MTQWIFGGMAGLFLGMMWRISRLYDPENLRSALGLKSSAALKTALAALGFGMMLLSLMMYLAVMDTDLLEVPALSWATLMGAALLGAGAAAGGFLPMTALAGVGGGRFPEGVCACAGVLAGTVLVPFLRKWTAGLSAPIIEGTLFEVTLFAPWHWQGRFLGLGGLGALVLVLSAYVPMPKKAPLMALPAPESEAVQAERSIDANADELLQEEESEESAEAQETEELPEDAHADTVVAVLPGEETLVVDTSQQLEESEESEAAEETEKTPVTEETSVTEETPGMTKETEADNEKEEDERSEEP